MKLFSKMALRNLWKNKRRSFSTGAAILAGFAGLCLLGGYIFRVEKYARVNSIYINHSGHLSIYKKGGLDLFYNNPRKHHLTGADLEKIQEILLQDENVEFTAPILKGMGLISNGSKSVPFLASGVDPQIEKRIQSHSQVFLWAPELLPDSTEPSYRTAAGDLTEKLSITKELGSLIGRKVPFSSLSDSEKDVQLAARSFHGDLNAVNGILEFRHSTGFSMLEDMGLMAPFSLLQNLYDTDGATYLAVYLDPDVDVGAFVKKLQSKLDQAKIDVEVHPFDDERISLFYTGIMGFLYIMTGFFVFLIFGAVALSIINSMTIGIIERVREIGTLRAIGFTDSQTAWLFTLESLYLTAISIGIGYVVAQLVATTVNNMDLRVYPPGIAGHMKFVLSPELWICALIAIPILIICVICAYFVSKRMVNKPIIQLLQQVN